MLLASIILFVVALLFTMIFKVQDVHLGLPSDFFRGRIIVGEGGLSIPIREPYKEGLHLRKPWYSIKQISREVKTRTITRREYQVSEGGTVFLSGVIQYRASSIALYRYVEVDEQAIEDGLDSELDQIVSKLLADANIEKAVTRKTNVAEKLKERLCGTVLNPDREEGSSELTRKLFNKDITYVEHSYGIELVKVKIDTIDPSEELKKARDDMQKENYQKISETTEWNHLLEKAEVMKQKFPGISDELAIQAVQLWQKHSTKDVKQISVDGIKELVPAIVDLLKK